MLDSDRLKVGGGAPRIGRYGSPGSICDRIETDPFEHLLVEAKPLARDVKLALWAMQSALGAVGPLIQPAGIDADREGIADLQLLHPALDTAGDPDLGVTLTLEGCRQAHPEASAHRAHCRLYLAQSERGGSD